MIQENLGKSLKSSQGIQNIKLPSAHHHQYQDQSKVK